MSYLQTTIRGTPCMVDTLAPTVPITSLPGPAGDLIAETSARQLELSDRIIDLADFGAAGNGTTDDTEALIDALGHIKASGERGGIFVPPGTVKFTSTLTLDTDDVMICGAGLGRSVLDFRGSGDAILVTNHSRVRLADFKVRTQGSTGQTNGIRFSYNSSTTAFRHILERVSAVGFTGGAGFKYTNNELTITRDCWAYGCDKGFVADNSDHTGSALGINNQWIGCRAEECVNNAWDISAQSSAIFDGCQGFALTVPTGNVSSNAYFYMHGGCTYCRIFGLDVEYHGGDVASATGLHISGTGHQVQVNAFFLAQAIRCSSNGSGLFLPQKFSSCTAGLLLDSGSSGNRIIDTGYQITNQGTGNYRIGGGGTRSGVVAKTGTYQILATDSVVECDASGGAFTATLPTPSTVIAGTHYWVKKVDSSGNAVTVGGTIDGATNYSLASQYKCLHVAVNAAGTAYYILGAY